MEEIKFNPKYLEQVEEAYPRVASDLAPDIPFRSEKTDTQYVVVRPRDAEGEVIADAETIMYVPGFGEGIDNKASMAGELAMRGFNVILPEQNREEKVGRLGVTALQAEIFDDVMKGAAELEDIKPASIVLTHSYGSLIGEAMVAANPEDYADKTMILLAPAGVINNERYPKLALRCVKFMASEMNKKRRADFPDHKGYTGNSSFKRLIKRPLRTLREVQALRKEKINFSKLLGNVGSLHVATYGHDKMYPSDMMSDTIAKDSDVNEGKYVGWSSPIDAGYIDSNGVHIPPKGGSIRAGATHDDEQFNPSRVANVVEWLIANPTGSKSSWNGGTRRRPDGRRRNSIR